MKKKLFSLLAMLLSLVMILSACGGKTDDGNDDDTDKVGVEDFDVTGYDEEAAKLTVDTEIDGVMVPAGRIPVRYWCPHGSGTSKNLDNIAVNVFNESQDKYFIVRTYQGGYYDQLAKLQATEQADLPALVNSSSETVGSYLHSGLIVPVQNYVEADANYVDPKLYGNLVATYGLGGELIGYPMSLSLSGFFYNVDVFKAAGIDPYSIVSMDDVYAACEKICKGGFAKYGIAEEHSGIWANYAFHRAGYYTVDNDNGMLGLPTKCLYDDNTNGFADVVTKYYTHWKNISDNGYLYPFGSKMKEDLIPALGRGELAMLVTTNSYQANVIDAFGDNTDGFGFVPMFSADANGKNSGYCSSGQGLFVVDNGNKAAMMGAWEFIKFFSTPEIQVEWDKKTGYLPLSEAIYNSAAYQEYLKSFPYVQKIIDAMKGADLSAFYAFTATNNTYSPAGATALEEIFNGTPVADAIATMVATINEDFELYNATNVG